MNNTVSERILNVDTLTHEIQADPLALIRHEETRYATEIAHTARNIANRMHGRTVLMLSGPSSAGKTTSAHLVKKALTAHGIDTQIVSLDDFYKGRGLAPRLPDGSYDYESVEALDLVKLQQCLNELLNEGCSELPIFDFTTHSPAPHTRTLQLTDHSLVIFEGIHALNPFFEEHLPKGKVFTMFVNTLSPFWQNSEKCLARRDIRLMRRLLRDLRFRSSSFENTLDMWRQVVRGEQLYLFPYAGDTVNFRLDTTHAYEPFLFAAELLPLLKEVSESPFRPQLTELAQKLERFEPLSLDLVPSTSLLREFFG